MGVKRKHNYFLIDLFVINDVSVKLALREFHENMISFVAYDGSFNLSFHFHVYVNTNGTPLLHLISKFGTREWIIETSGTGKIYSLKKIVPH